MIRRIVMVAITGLILLLAGCGSSVQESQLVSNVDVSADRITAYILSKNKKLGANVARDMAETIIRESRKKGLNPLIVTALINKESSFRPDAVSSSNAKGVAQFKDATARSVGVDDPFDYRQSIAGLCRYLKMLYNNYDDRDNAMELALASYRMGPTYIKKNVIKGGAPLPEAARTYIDKIKSEASKI